jgi:hypothetical protein
MAMRRVGLAVLTAGLLTLISGSTVRADNDTIRLGTSGSGAVSNVDDDTTTELVVWRGGYRSGGGFRGGYGGFRGGYGGFRGGYGGFRGGYGFGYGGYRYGGYGFGYGGYTGYYGGYYGGYRPYYHHHFRPYYWRISYSPTVYYYAYAVDDVVVPSTGYVAPLTQTQVLPVPAVAPAPPNGNLTYPYDGGPTAPVPLPAPTNADPGTPQLPTVPLTGKIVSLPRQTTSGSTQYMTQLVSTTTQAAVPAYAYPAYGETSLPSVRKSR